MMLGLLLHAKLLRGLKWHISACVLPVCPTAGRQVQ